MTTGEHGATLQAHELNLLRRIAADAPLQEVLDDLCRSLQALACVPLRCAVMVVDAAGGRIRCTAAPDLDAAFRAECDVALGDEHSSCTRALRQRMPVILAGALASGRAEGGPARPRRHVDRSVWSYPILQGETPLGTLAFFPEQPGLPDRRDRHLISFGIQVARLALAHERSLHALRESEARFREFSDLAADWFWEQDRDFRFTDVSYGPGSRPAAPPYYDRGAIGLCRWELPYVNVPDGFWEAHRSLLAAARPFSALRLQRRDDDGALRHVEISGKPLFDARGALAGYRGVGRDVTAEVLAGERLRAAEEWLRLAIRAAGIGLWERDVDSGSFRFTPGWKAQFGYAEDEIGDGAVQFDRMVHPDDLDGARGAARRYLDRPLGDYEDQFRLRHKDGSWRWVLSRGTLIADPATGRRRWMGCHIDITEQRLLLEALRSQEARVGELNLTLEERVRARTAELEAANRELDAFNHSVSHDLRVPLRSIAGFSQALSENHAAALDASGQDYLRRIDHAARRMDRLIDALHRLSRLPRAPLHLRSIDLSSRVEAIIAELRAAEPLRQVEVCVAPNLLGDGDPALLALLLANLVGNAWKFTSRTPGARIEFGAAADAHGNRALFVRDNGVGFDMQFADRLFTPFRRLHREEEFSGPGIGLATAQRIVQRHGGRIWAQAAKGRGASFHFTLWDDVALRHELEHGLRARIA